MTRDGLFSWSIFQESGGIVARSTTGRKVTDWDFKVGETEITVPVKMREIDGGSFEFTAVSKKHGIRISGPDINLLKNDVEASLKELASVEWTDYMLLRVTSSSVGESDDETDEVTCHCSLSIKCEPIQISKKGKERSWRYSGSVDVNEGLPDIDRESKDKVVLVIPRNEGMVSDIGNLNCQLMTTGEEIVQALSEKDPKIGGIHVNVEVDE